MLSRGQDRFRVVFCGRERNAVATASRSRGADSGSDVRGELACCRVLEYLSHVDVDVEDLAQTHGQSRCDQRIAALVEEAACDINGFEVQEFTEYRRDGFFHRVTWQACARLMRSWVRQAISVQFAVRRGRQSG